jgi:thiol-disulfide isomerase/thioredoxin
MILVSRRLVAHPSRASSNRRGNYLLSAFLAFILLVRAVGFAETKPMGFAISFPNLSFEHILSKEEQAYLEVPSNKSFAFQEIQGGLILVEFLSVYCVNCQRQAPILNGLYSSIEKDKALRGKVKMIGIAAGNNLREIGKFRKEYNVTYPILSDVRFDAHTTVGSPRTPFSIWVRKERGGSGIVVSTHLGLMDSEKMALNETRAVLQYDFALLKPKKGPVYKGESLKPPLAEEELRAKAKRWMEASGGKVLQIEKVLLKDGDWIYAGKVDFGTRWESLFSKLASRRAVCDICHDTFFIYTFDAEGKVVEIVPIQLTKNDNLPWTEEDIQKLRSQTLGRSILKPFPFDSSVDSVSGATITAALVFETLDKAKEIYVKLKREKYIK